jgi:hypothetical protein
MLITILVHVMKKVVVARNKNHLTERQTYNFILQSIQETQFKVSFAKLTVPMYSIDQFVYGLHVEFTYRYRASIRSNRA